MGSIKNGYDAKIDLVKFCAAIFIVILHTINYGKGARELVYLIGTYGIPMFLLVNGYLRSRSTQCVNVMFVGKCLTRYIIFDIVWSLIISTKHFALEQTFDFLETFYGALVGEGDLYHLWFLTGLLIVYLIVAISTRVFGKSWVDNFIDNSHFMIITVALMSISFVCNVLLNVFFHIEIRDVVLPPFRVVTNAGYYFIGMHFGKKMTYKATWKDRIDVRLITVVGAVVLMWLFAENLGMYYASSYYSSPLIIAGTIALFFLLHENAPNINNAKLQIILKSSTGIWILHPFILVIFRKILNRIPLEDTLFISIVITLLTVCFTALLSLVLLKTKYLKRLISP